MGETERGGETMTDEKIIDLFFERSEQAIPAPAAPSALRIGPFRRPFPRKFLQTVYK